MAAKRSGSDHEEENRRILAALDIIAEYEALGVRFASQSPRSSGTIECYARDRDEKRPSAFVNVETGRYIDKGGENENLSLWDFAAKYGSFGDWKACRKHYAEKAGVTLAGDSRAKRQSVDPLDSIQFEDWNDARRGLVGIWCKKFKQGVTLDAVLRAGGQYGRYPIKRNKQTGEKYGGEFPVICLPCWCDKLPPSAEPVAWVLFNVTGPSLPIWRGDDIPKEWAKMKTIGPSRGTLMNRHALELLAAGHKPELIIKTGGPSDMLAVMSAQPPDLHDRHLVTTNASGEGGDVLASQVKPFLVAKTLIYHDADTAGLVGRRKWLGALSAAGHHDARAIKLPYLMQEKGGRDARDFLNGIKEPSR